MDRRSWNRFIPHAGMALALAVAFGGAIVTRAAASDEHIGPWPQERQGWLIGFGLGGGSAGLTVKSDPQDSLAAESDNNREGGTTVSFRFGYAFNSQIAVELESGGWTKAENAVTVTFTNFGVALSYYPGGGGLMLRGGIGYGAVDFSAQISGETLTLRQTGFSPHLAAGYEFRVRRTFAIGPLVTYNYVSTDSFKANWVDGELAFNWYFIPQH